MKTLFPEKKLPNSFGVYHTTGLKISLGKSFLFIDSSWVPDSIHVYNIYIKLLGHRSRRDMHDISELLFKVSGVKLPDFM